MSAASASAESTCATPHLLFKYNAKPVPVGPIEDRGTSSILHLDPSAAPEDRWVPLILLPTMLVFPILQHLVGTRNSDGELEELLNFLRHTIQAS